MDDHINDLRMPTDEVKRIKERIARLLGDVNAAEAKILNEGGSMAREVMPLVLQLRALRAQLKNLELGETNQPTDPGPGSGSTKVEQVQKVAQPCPGRKVEFHPTGCGGDGCSN